MDPLWLKALHLISAALLFGTGLGTAFQMWLAGRTGDPAVISVVARNTVLADWLFTLPAVVVQPISGILLAGALGYPIDSLWIVSAGLLYLLAGFCWLPVVFLQQRIASLARGAAVGRLPLPPAAKRLLRIWFWLGWPAFVAVLAIYHLMIFKPEGLMR